MDFITSLLFLCPVMFLASFVDAISGGGGLLSLPAFLFTGMPVHNAYGCNKIGCFTSTCMSSYRFLKSGMMDKKVAAATGIVTLLCSAAASKLVLWLPDRPLRIMILVSMPFVAVLILANRSYSEEDHSSELSTMNKYGLCLLTGVLMGFYDGMLGPGSGTLAILLYTKFFKYDLKKASGNAKAAVLASSFAASLSHILAGTVIWSITIPAVLCGLLGSYAGAGMALKKGARFIRPMMLVIAFLLILKLALDLAGVL